MSILLRFFFRVSKFKTKKCIYQPRCRKSLIVQTMKSNIEDLHHQVLIRKDKKIEFVA